MAELTTDHVRSLDQTRQRLLALHKSLVALGSELVTQNPLPSWSALQLHANLVSNNLQTIASQLAEHRDTYQSTVAFPTPQFPGTQRSFILETLLRTKLEPDVEEWIEAGENVSAQQHKTTFRGLSDDDRNALWQWAPGVANGAARKQKWGADFTLEEKQKGVENVATGLRRQLVEPPDDEGEEEPEEEEDEFEISDEEDEGEDGDKMDVEKQPPKTEASPASTALPTAGQMTLGALHKFMTTGR
ncbi:uncharacterized protein Z519_00566 [Cladophialophora bantiana CBS 173.52]|uniref:Mediator of RNA polymerase II transcription subunit 8 n=1 Tax=Cladophialophora bantiana (strain ATCC 10958 / CBS 173.52 / CDC B-1940 / NIH 8579) TaxID=1442370 RepID=A0A0D2HZL6_CLAB1|nr:uncharacterized protein Z519_00566 [Cladophialophora bantiana CBS 173.52]KIW98903.1 hypothetical protein Z519_00566 [Cladophialophora bantiana CBS 173.52]